MEANDINDGMNAMGSFCALQQRFDVAEIGVVYCCKFPCNEKLVDTTHICKLVVSAKYI